MGNTIRNTSSFGYPSGLTISARYLAHLNQKHGELNAACICGRADVFCHNQDFPLVFRLSTQQPRTPSVRAHLATHSATAPGPWGPRLTANIRGPARSACCTAILRRCAKQHTSTGSIIGEAHRDERRRGVLDHMRYTTSEGAQSSVSSNHLTTRPSFETSANIGWL